MAESLKYLSPLQSRYRGITKPLCQYSRNSKLLPDNSERDLHLHHGDHVPEDQGGGGSVHLHSRPEEVLGAGHPGGAGGQPGQP